MISTDLEGVQKMRHYTDSNYWDSIADEYAKERSVSDVDRKVFETINSLKPSNILEIGCGAGVFAEYLIMNSQEKLNYCATDFSEKFIEITKERLGRFQEHQISFIHSDPEKLELKKASFDVVLSMAVLHHLSIKVIKSTFEKIRSILNQHGFFIMVEDWAFSPINKFQEAACYLRKKIMEYENVKENHIPELEWEDMLLSSGFKVEKKIHIDRVLKLDRFMVLKDDVCKFFIETIENVEECNRKIPMTIFVCDLCNKA